MRQAIGAIVEYEKRLLLPSWRPGWRKRMVTAEKVEGPKSHAEGGPDVDKLAKGSRPRSPGGKPSLRATRR